MPPAKASKLGHDDPKSETTASKEKNGHASGSLHSNGKLRRVASSTGSQLREVTNASSSGPTSAPVAKHDAHNPGIQWNTFDRDMLHAYRREHRLNTPAAFSSSYHQLVLSQPGSLGQYSPTMARRKENRRQSKEHLAMAVRKHFNGSGVQENEVIVDFIHKVKSQGVTKGGKLRRMDLALQEPER